MTNHKLQDATHPSVIDGQLLDETSHKEAARAALPQAFETKNDGTGREDGPGWLGVFVGG